MSQSGIRSPSYPYLSLSDALAKARPLHDKYRTGPIARADAAKEIGYSGLSGPANQSLAALAAYGLLERAGKGDARVTERAVAILHAHSDREKRENLEAAAFTPPLFQKLRERYVEGVSPPEDAIASYLSREGFNANIVRRVAKVYLKTLACLEEEGVTESHGSQSSEGAQSPPSDADSPPSGANRASNGDRVRVDDLIQWEAQGALRLEKPRRVRAISDDGNWVFVEDSETGIPMNEAIVQERTPAADPPTPPTLPLETNHKLVQPGESEWLQVPVAKGTSARVMVKGDMGPKEVKRLISILQMQHDMLAEEEGDKICEHNA